MKDKHFPYQKFVVIDKREMIDFKRTMRPIRIICLILRLPGI